MSIKSKMVGVLNRVIRSGYWFREIRFKDCQKFWSYKTFNTDVVNLGSTSSVCAFDYKDIPMKCANWALSTNPLSGDYAILKNYFGYLREGHSTVIWSLCPFSSLAGSYSVTDDRYYSLLYPSSIPCFSKRRQLQIKAEVNYPLLSYPLLAIYTDIKNYICGNNQKILSDQQMNADAERWMNNWMKEFNIVDFSYPLSMINQDAIREAEKILNDMTTFCKERSIRLVILIPPVYYTLGELFTPDIRDVIINSLVDKIDGESVMFYNYLDDADFCRDRTLFQNSFLLNKKGARAFTRRVLSDIRLYNN